MQKLHDGIREPSTGRSQRSGRMSTKKSAVNTASANSPSGELPSLYEQELHVEADWVADYDALRNRDGAMVTPALVGPHDAVPANVSHFSHTGLNNSQFHGPDNLRATSPHPVATVAEPAAANVVALPIAPQADQSAAQQPVSSSI